MEYTIKKLASMSGVSSRTLRYYDEISLLKPKRVNSNGYRIYGQDQLVLLQQILFYRELGVSLEEIKVILLDKNFSLENALKSHLNNLQLKRDNLDILIANVSKSLIEIEGGIEMSNKERFEGFKKDLIKNNEEKYGKEIREKYSEETVNASNEKFASMSEEEWQIQENIHKEMFEKLKIAIFKDDPACTEAFDACELHKKWLNMFWKDGMYSKEAHIGLAQMYVYDERFTAFYDEKLGEGTAVFFLKAIENYTK